MGFISQVIVPRLCDLLLNKPLLARHRRELIATAHGDVLEIGFGTGMNLPYYPEQVRKITAVDPNVAMHRLAQKRVRRAGIDVDQRLLSGERLPYAQLLCDAGAAASNLAARTRDGSQDVNARDNAPGFVVVSHHDDAVNVGINHLLS